MAEPTTGTAPSRGSSGPVTGADIELCALAKRFPGERRAAVEGVSLRIAGGETVVLVGPSGCGKSTTLRMVNRLVEPTSGRVLIGGEDVTAMDPVALRRRVGYAIQSCGLFPHMTVAQNVAQVPRMLRWPRARVAARVEEMLALVGLEPAVFRGRYPRQLSGGQQQRVGVARALAADPPVLLMDEPFGAVDPLTRERLQDELLRMQERLRKTILFVTHDFDEAVRLGDRIAVLGAGCRVAQFDTPEAVLARPADAFVADFVGGGAALRRLHLARVADLDVPAGPPAPGTAGTERSIPGDATVRDALEAVLTDRVGRVAVTGEHGERAGVLDSGTLMDALRRLLAQGRAGGRKGRG